MGPRDHCSRVQHLLELRACMKTKKFNYDLPKHLIAQYPTKNRTDSRLLVALDCVKHEKFKSIVNYFNAGDLLVLNHTITICLTIILANILTPQQHIGTIYLYGFL